MPGLVDSLKSRLKLWLLSIDQSPALQAVGRALGRLSVQTLSAEEAKWVESIEALRREVYHSEAEIVKVDFGAGGAEDVRAKDEMDAGVDTRGKVGEIARLTSKRPFWAGMLFRLVRELRPATCIEMGTSVGLSACYQAAALACNGTGKLVTLEGDPTVADIARANLAKIKLDRVEVVVGRFSDTLDKVLRDLQSVDYVFVDGHHDEVATVEYWQQMKPFLADSALVIFDDIGWSPGMRRAWDRLCQDPNFVLAIDLDGVGVCVYTKQPRKQRHFWFSIKESEAAWNQRFPLP